MGKSCTTVVRLCVGDKDKIQRAASGCQLLSQVRDVEVVKLFVRGVNKRRLVRSKDEVGIICRAILQPAGH